MREDIERGLRAIEEAGRAIAEGRPLPPLNPHVLHALTGGKLGEPLPEGGPLPALGAGTVRLHAARRLAELYLEETGLDAAHAAYAAELEAGGPFRVSGRLTEAEQRELEEAEDRLSALYALTVCLMAEGSGLRIEQDGENPTAEDLVEAGRVSEEDARAARELLEQHRREGKPLTLGGNASRAGFHQGLPGAAEALATFSRLMEKAAPTEADRAEVVALFLTPAPASEPQPSLDAWLEARDRQSLFDVTASALGRIAAELRAEAAEAEAEQLREDLGKAKRRPHLRQGTAALRALLTTGDHVDKARRQAIVKLGDKLPPEKLAAYKLFQYEPLGWSERLAIHGLAAIAHEQGRLDAHPWATAVRPVAGHPTPRIRLEYPGTTELARLVGYAANDRGKIDRSKRQTIERALTRLCTVPRWIPVRVKVPPAKKGEGWRDDVEVKQTLWLEAATTLFDQGVYLDLHPAAIASHLRSFMDVEELATRYEGARDAIGKRQMRDEWAVADDYLRLLAIGAAGGAGLLRAAPGTTAEGETVTATTSEETMLRTLGLEARAKSKGLPSVRRRVREALAFCEAMGTLQQAELREGVWHLTLPHPGARGAQDGRQYLLLSAAGSPE